MSTGNGAALLPRDKPAMSFWQIWNMCFGFLGIQFGFALQNANVSRIFQTLGASVDDIPALSVFPGRRATGHACARCFPDGAVSRHCAPEYARVFA